MKQHIKHAWLAILILSLISCVSTNNVIREPSFQEYRPEGKELLVLCRPFNRSYDASSDFVVAANGVGFKDIDKYWGKQCYRTNTQPFEVETDYSWTNRTYTYTYYELVFEDGLTLYFKTTEPESFNRWVAPYSEYEEFLSYVAVSPAIFPGSSLRITNGVYYTDGRRLTINGTYEIREDDLAALISVANWLHTPADKDHFISMVLSSRLNISFDEEKVTLSPNSSYYDGTNRIEGDPFNPFFDLTLLRKTEETEKEAKHGYGKIDDYIFGIIKAEHDLFFDPEYLVVISEFWDYSFVFELNSFELNYNILLDGYDYRLDTIVTPEEMIDFVVRLCLEYNDVYFLLVEDLSDLERIGRYSGIGSPKYAINRYHANGFNKTRQIALVDIYHYLQDHDFDIGYGAWSLIYYNLHEEEIKKRLDNYFNV